MSTSNLKISIAALSLSAFSFTAGLYLPYVIAAVSGSGTIVAVPLAIFAVSAVVALISATYLIKLAGSRADNKKEAGPDGEESGHIASQEPQKFVCENCTSLENKPIGEELIKQDSGSQTEVDNGTNSRDKSSVPTPPPLPQGAVPPPPPPPPLSGTQINPPAALKEAKKSKTDAPASTPSSTELNNLAEEIKKFKFKRVAIVQQGPVKGSDALESNQCTDKNETPEEYVARLDNVQKKKNTDSLTQALYRRAEAMGNNHDSSDDESTSIEEWEEEDEQQELSDSQQDEKRGTSALDSGNVSDDEDWETDPEPIEQASSGSQSLHRERSGSLDSGHGSDDNVKPQSTPPPHSAPKADKPLISPKPVNLKTKSEAPPAAQVNNVDPVNSEVQESSTSSLKDRIKLLNLQGGSPVFPH